MSFTLTDLSWFDGQSVAAFQTKLREPASTLWPTSPENVTCSSGPIEAYSSPVAVPVTFVCTSASTMAGSLSEYVTFTLALRPSVGVTTMFVIFGAGNAHAAAQRSAEAAHNRHLASIRFSIKVLPPFFHATAVVQKATSNSLKATWIV